MTELNKLKSPCYGCVSETNKVNHSCNRLPNCLKYLKWYKEVMTEVRLILMEEKTGCSFMKKCARCKHGVYVELWGEWKCRKFEKFCYNKDSYYDHCKEFVKRGNEKDD